MRFHLLLLVMFSFPYLTLFARFSVLFSSSGKIRYAQYLVDVIVITAPRAQKKEKENKNI